MAVTSIQKLDLSDLRVVGKKTLSSTNSSHQKISISTGIMLKTWFEGDVAA